ncbi:MAG: hypothetical protein L6R45_07720 [Anaerolineae bacterium]|nr:hypothetical protein [Anaerolineae bacterium]
MPIGHDIDPIGRFLDEENAGQPALSKIEPMPLLTVEETLDALGLRSPPGA